MNIVRPCSGAQRVYYHAVAVGVGVRKEVVGWIDSGPWER